MKSINPNIFPKGGWVYQERDGARIFGTTWEGVIARVDNYRRRAGYPIGDVRADVMAQACMNNPMLCIEDNPHYEAQLKKSNLKTRVLVWLAKLIPDQDKQFATEFDANNRAAVCASCPHNVAIPEGCSSCKAALEESRRAVIGGRMWDARLHQCAVLGEDLNTARWLERQRVDNGALPAHCWQKRQN